MHGSAAAAGWWHSDADIGALCREGYTTIALEHPQEVEAALDAATEFLARRQDHAAAALPAPSSPREARRETFVLQNLPAPSALGPAVAVWPQLDGMGACVLAEVAVQRHLPPRQFVDLLDDGGSLGAAPAASLLRVSRYPATCSETLPGHHDIGLITIVSATGSSALQVLDLRAMRWHAVEAGLAPGRAVVMAGLALQRLTVGGVSACYHRLGPALAGRTSLVFQHRPRADASLMWPTTVGGATGREPPCTGAELMAELRCRRPSVADWATLRRG